MDISLSELFDMDLWQFICYIEGNRKKRILSQIDDVVSAARIGMYVGQYWTGKRAPDANNTINKLASQLDNKVPEENEDDDAIERIEMLKENLKKFD